MQREHLLVAGRRRRSSPADAGVGRATRQQVPQPGRDRIVCLASDGCPRPRASRVCLEAVEMRSAAPRLRPPSTGPDQFVAGRRRAASASGGRRPASAGSRTPDALTEPVAQLDGGQRVEAQLLERPARRRRPAGSAWPSTAATWLRTRSSRTCRALLGVGSPASRGRRAPPVAVAAGRRRVPAAGPGRAAAAAAVAHRARSAPQVEPGRRDDRGRSAGQRGVEQRQRLVGGQRREPAAAEPLAGRPR